MAALGFIGLGAMGGPMARNLAAASGGLMCHDADPAKAGTVSGAVWADSVEEVAQKARIVFLCLPDGAAVMAVCRGIAACEGCVVETVVDSTTAGPADARAAHDALGEAGIRYADGPVSGGVAGAEAGTLAMMVAAPDELFAQIEPHVRAMAKNARQVGTRPGQGMAMKLLNNYLSAIAMIATSEAVSFGLSQGLDMETILETVNLSTGRNTATSGKFPRNIATGAFDSGFATRLMAKDIRLYDAGVQEAGTPRRLARLVLEIWDGMEAAHPESDFTEIYLHVRDGGTDG